MLTEHRCSCNLFTCENTQVLTCGHPRSLNKTKGVLFAEHRCPESFEGKRCEKEVAHPSILKGEDGAFGRFRRVFTTGLYPVVPPSWHGMTLSVRRG